MQQLQLLDLTNNCLLTLNPHSFRDLGQLKAMWFEHNLISKDEELLLKSMLPQCHLIPKFYYHLASNLVIINSERLLNPPLHAQ